MTEENHQGRRTSDIGIARLEEQMARYASDLESEKDTRSRTNSDLTIRIDKAVERLDAQIEALGERIGALERRIWIASGGLAGVIFLANFLFRGHQ